MARFTRHRPLTVWVHPEGEDPQGPFLATQMDVEVTGGNQFQPGDEIIRVTMVRSGPQPTTKEESQDMSQNISTKEQVKLRTEMADVIKEAVEAKYGKVRTWVETEQVGPLGGVSAQVFGAVDHEGVVVPFAISVYSDARIQEKLEDQLEQDAENGALRSKLGW